MASDHASCIRLPDGCSGLIALSVMVRNIRQDDSAPMTRPERPLRYHKGKQMSVKLHSFEMQYVRSQVGPMFIGEPRQCTIR